MNSSTPENLYALDLLEIAVRSLKYYTSTGEWTWDFFFFLNILKEKDLIVMAIDHQFLLAELEAEQQSFPNVCFSLYTSVHTFSIIVWPRIERPTPDRTLFSVLLWPMSLFLFCGAYNIILKNWMNPSLHIF